MNLTDENRARNCANDPDCTSHCGCGVPFTLDCPGCKEYLGDEYNSPDQTPASRDGTRVDSGAPKLD